MHRLPAHCKLAAAVLFILLVVATPRESFWAFGAYAALLIAVALAAEVPARFVAKRLPLEIPFVLFAVFLPLVGRGPRTDTLGVSLSVEGLWAAWNIVAKATIGLTTTVLLGASTRIPDILRGMERLRVPAALTNIAGFMVRYLEVILDELRRMKIARLSRAYDPRWVWQARAVATTAGALFVRSYERGERVYLAMASRGFDGSLPDLEEPKRAPASWAGAMALPASAAFICLLAWAMR